MRMFLWEKRRVSPNPQQPEALAVRKQGAKPPPKTEGGPRRVPLAIGRTYEGFLELPVPVVLVVLWLLGALMLGAVVIGVYWAVAWLSAAIALL